MSIEIIGMVGPQDVSESRGSSTGPAIDIGYLTRFARAHEAAGFDRVLIGYHATGPDGFAVAAGLLAVGPDVGGVGRAVQLGHQAPATARNVGGGAYREVMTAQTPPKGGTQTQPVGGTEGTGLGTRADGIGHAAPAGYATVTPWVITSDTGRLIEFVQEAFGAHELARVPGPDGRVGHAEVRIGDAVVMMFDRADDWPDTPGFLRLYVEDADLVYQRALAAGATPVTPVTGLFFGDRVGRVRDPLGNIWWIQAHVEDVDPAELARRPRDPGAMAALRFVETSLDVAMRPN